VYYSHNKLKCLGVRLGIVQGVKGWLGECLCGPWGKHLHLGQERVLMWSRGECSANEGVFGVFAFKKP
jgi:hypothetical protein